MINLLLICAIFGFVLSSIIFFKKAADIVSARLLGCFYFLLSVYALQAYLIDGGYLENFQWFFLWPLLIYHLMFIPMYYYFKTTLNDQFKLHPAELLLVVPFVLGLIDVIYVYSQPYTLYNNIIMEAIYNPEKRLGAQYWLLSLEQHTFMRHFWQLILLVILFPKIKYFVRRKRDEKLKINLNSWLIIFWSILVVMAVLACIYALEKMYQKNFFHSLLIIGKDGGIITFLLYIALFLIGVIPVYFPSILYGFPQKNKSALPINQLEEDNRTDTLKFGLDKDEIKIKLNSLEKSKSFLNHNFNLSQCAKELNMPQHHISYFLKDQYEVSFAAYKNSLRMKNAQELIEQGFLENNTIEALANECGFSSRTSFSRIFKEFVGFSPREYANDLKEVKV